MDNTTGKKYTSSLVVLISLFFMWGFMTCLNDILIPYLKGVFQLMHWQAMLVQFAFFGAYFIGSVIYFIISVYSGDPINRIGYKKGIITGLIISAIGTALFYPAAQFISYGFFLAALFVLGLGFTLLQIAANPYVAILGDPQTASSRLNLAQAFNSFGTFIAPLIGGYLIYELFGDNPGADSVKIPYLAFSLVFLVIAVIIQFSYLPRFENLEVIEKGMGALHYPQLVLGIIAIFMYVGAEVSIGSILTGFLGLPEIAGLSKSDATIFVSLYWGGLMIGRFTGSVSLSNIPATRKIILTILIPFITFLFMLLVFHLKGTDVSGLWIYLPLIFLNVIGFLIGRSIPSTTLSIFALICVIILLIGLISTGKTAMFAIIGIGLFNSIMWSNIFTLAINGLGKYTSQGSSLLVMAILGGALIPPLQGYIADVKGVQFSFIVPVLCYVYLVFYGWKMKKIV
ncbi:MAG TPA: sugar MFS transporter [Bacteroidia bacterium]|nr:sugar MFS transporter [Bacteroidia bacterium]